MWPCFGRPCVADLPAVSHYIREAWQPVFYALFMGPQMRVIGDFREVDEGVTAA